MFTTNENRQSTRRRCGLGTNKKLGPVELIDLARQTGLEQVTEWPVLRGVCGRSKD